MSNVVAGSSLNMYNLPVWDGDLVRADATTIEFRGGAFTSRYTGRFYYDGAGNPYGTVTGIAEFIDGRPHYALTGTALDVQFVITRVYYGDTQSIVQAALAGADMLTGSSQNDTLYGHTGNDTLWGNAGNDRLAGDVGNDALFGGIGNDVLIGGDGIDTAFYGGTANIGVSLNTTGVQATGHGLDQLWGIENLTAGSGADRLTGSALANRLSGNEGGDVLSGLGGNDTLLGGAGADVLTGGAGQDALYGGADALRDVFVFAAIGDSAVGVGRDMIFDFRRGIDDIDLRSIDANLRVAGDQAFRFTGGTAAANAVWAVASGTAMILRGDVNGDARPDFEVTLAGLAGIGAGDLLL